MIPKDQTKALNETDSRSTPTLVDILSEKDIFVGPGGAVFVFGMAVVLLTLYAVILFANSFTSISVASVTLACLGIAAWAAYRAYRRRIKSRLLRCMNASAGRPLDERISMALDAVRGMHAPAAVETLAQALVSEGYAGCAVRVVREKELTPLTPLDRVFEPCAFVDIDRIEEGDEADGRRKPTPRGFYRNILLAGGWPMLILTVYWIGAELIESFHRRKVTYMAYFWIAILILFFCNSSVLLGWIAKQWLAVPGGLVLRKAGKLSRRWILYLFDRRKSACVLYKYQGHRWQLVIADALCCDSAFGTRAELEQALRAWSSPQTPPDVGLLGDLTCDSA